MHLFASAGILIWTAITEKSELVECYARDIQEYFARDDGIEVFKCGFICTIGHQKRRDSAGKSAKMVTDTVFNCFFGLFFFLGFDGADDRFSGRMNESIYSLSEFSFNSSVARALFSLYSVFTFATSVAFLQAATAA